MRRRPVRAKKHRLGLRCVQHHHDQGVERSGHLGQTARRAALGEEPLHLRRGDVEAVGDMAGAQNRAAMP